MELNQSITINLSKDIQNVEQTQNQFCSEDYVHFFEEYNDIDHQVKVFLGGLGFIANLINIFVFTRREMRNPLNTILLALAVADGLFLLTVFTANCFMWTRLVGSQTTPFYWNISHGRAVEYAIYTSFYYFFHYCTIYLMILVALWRMLGITFPLKSKRWLTERNARWGILGAVLFSLVIAATSFGFLEIKSWQVPGFWTGTRAVTLYFAKVAEAEENFIFMTYAICTKIIPSLLLTIFTVILLLSLVRARKGRSEMMMANSTPISTATQTSQEISGRGEVKSGQNSASSFDRTTKLLLTLVLIFLVTEMPDALFTILAVSVTSEDFSSQCLSPPVFFLMMLECLSSCSSFFIYLGMSTTFRSVFIALFKPFKK